MKWNLWSLYFSVVAKLEVFYCFKSITSLKGWILMYVNLKIEFNIKNMQLVNLKNLFFTFKRKGNLKKNIQT